MSDDAKPPLHVQRAEDHARAMGDLRAPRSILSWIYLLWIFLSPMNVLLPLLLFLASENGLGAWMPSGGGFEYGGTPLAMQIVGSGLIQGLFAIAIYKDWRLGEHRSAAFTALLAFVASIIWTFVCASLY